ncbi:MAG: DUF262 domain-containing protein [Muribaculaceae bacterium]
MAFELKPIYELFEYQFVIPAYQRGYRWDDRQMRDLLRDLRDFLQRNPTDHEYYCLQPIVVQKIEEKEYVLIDGQQRLTSIYMLLTYLDSNRRKQRVKYSFCFERRSTQDAFLKNATFADELDESYLKNIDTFYMRRAYDFIRKWFEEVLSENEQDTLPGNIRGLFSAPQQGKSAPCVKIIWYELPGDKPMEAFERLNYRRISLTGTELVKAMLLASNNSDVLDKDSLNRAHAWDAMEKELQDPLFWSMISTSTDRLAHIDFVLDIVADQINEELENDKCSRKLDESKFNYHVIDNYFRQLAAKYERRVIVENVWTRIENTYNKIRNWYDNPRWFHLIGLWRRLAPSVNIVSELLQLEHQAAGNGKDEFTHLLRRKVGALIAVDFRSDDEKTANKHPLEAVELNYEKHPKELLRILLAVNVVTAEQISTDVRFPFYLYDLYNETSLEHIHPQSASTTMTAQYIRRSTFSRIKQIEQNVDLQSPEVMTACEELRKEFENDDWANDLVRCSEKLWQKVERNLDIIDKPFRQIAQINDTELHSIANMALVNLPTNIVLSNHLLDDKRRILQQRNQRRISKDFGKTRIDTLKAHKDAMFLMPATERAFSKFYSSDNPGNMCFWQKNDRKAYFDALIEIYNYLTCK